MPNTKRTRRTRRRPRPAGLRVASCLAGLVRDAEQFFPPFRLPRSRSVRHLRNATIEVLEAMRALLDETIDWLRHEGRLSSELKRIRVEE
jgi:hypothetical protein